MHSRSVLESEIAAALESISPENLQRVAEDYARIRYPDRFSSFVSRAISVEGRSRSGWPDAWTEQQGLIDGVEATCAKSKAAIERHLHDYLEKMKSSKHRFAGFIHVAGSPSAQFGPQEVLAWRERFVNESGVPPEHLDLVFGSGLVSSLALPEFARTRAEILGLQLGPRHFKLVRSRRGPDEGRLDSAFVPSDEDYRSGSIYRPRAAELISERLDSYGCALVRGVGASGKSVLGWLLALEVSERRRPSYFLDLANYSQESRQASGASLSEELVAFGHPSVLFVMDNIHLDEALVKDLLFAWEDMSPIQRPKLLLLGRELRIGRGSLLDSVDLEPIALRARQLELAGVYRRLATRRRAVGADFPEPPYEILDQWLSIFGGPPRVESTTADLIAFSAAVLRRMPALLKGDWTLEAGDALEEIRTAYLSPSILSQDEYNNLIQLCVCEQLELCIPEESLSNPRAGFKTCSEHLGIVFRRDTGTSGHRLFSLAHGSLSELILRSVYIHVDPQAERLAIGKRFPFFASRIVERLVRAERQAEASSFIAALHEDSSFILDFKSLVYIHVMLRQIVKLGVPIPRDLKAQLDSDVGRDRLIDQALHTPLSHLAVFLQLLHSRSEFGQLLLAIADGLRAEGNRSFLLDQLSRTPIGYFALFLRDISQLPELRGVLTDIVEDLCAPANRDVLVGMAADSPVGYIGSFFRRLAHVSLANPLVNVLHEELSEEKNANKIADNLPETASLSSLGFFLGYSRRAKKLENIVAAIAIALQKRSREWFVETLLNTRLDLIASFLSECEKNDKLLPVLDSVNGDLAIRKNSRRLALGAAKRCPSHLTRLLRFLLNSPRMSAALAALVESLTEPAVVDELVEHAARTRLSHFSGFLQAIAEDPEFKTLHSMVRERLAHPELRQALAAHMARQPLDSIVGALTRGADRDIWIAVFLNIDFATWQRAWNAKTEFELGAFMTFRAVAVEKGRGEFAKYVASQAIQLSGRRDWDMKHIGLSHLAHVLWSGTDAPPGAAASFLERVVSPAWIGKQYWLNPAGQIATALCALAKQLDRQTLRLFVNPTLQRRILTDMRSGAREPIVLSDTLALLGAGSLLGMSVICDDIRWPDDDALTGVLEHWAPQSSHIDNFRIALWLGLREVARTRPDAVQLPERLAEQHFRLWTARRTRGTAQSSFLSVEADMLHWLHESRNRQWQLARPARA